MSKEEGKSNDYITNEGGSNLVRPDAPSIVRRSGSGGWVLERVWCDDRLQYTGHWVRIGDPTKRSVSIYSTPQKHPNEGNKGI